MSMLLKNSVHGFSMSRSSRLLGVSKRLVLDKKLLTRSFSYWPGQSKPTCKSMDLENMALKEVRDHLMTTVEQGDVEELDLFLRLTRDVGIAFNSPDAKFPHETPVEIAIQAGQARMVQELVNRSFPIPQEMCTHNGEAMKPLKYAILRGDVDLVSCLIQCGQTPDHLGDDDNLLTELVRNDVDPTVLKLVLQHLRNGHSAIQRGLQSAMMCNRMQLVEAFCQFDPQTVWSDVVTEALEEWKGRTVQYPAVAYVKGIRDGMKMFPISANLRARAEFMVNEKSKIFSGESFEGEKGKKMMNIHDDCVFSGEEKIEG